MGLAATSKRSEEATIAKMVPVREQPPYSIEMLKELRIVGLHCGSGRNLHAGWLNTDVMQIGVGRFRSKTGIIMRLGEAFYLQYDAAKRLPLSDESVPRVFAEHFLEHLSPKVALAWLVDVHRILSPGGTLRLSTPDLARYVQGYLDAEARFFGEHQRRLEAMGMKGTPSRRAWFVNQIFYHWGHRWIYDLDEVRHILMAAGFPEDEVRPCKFRESCDPRMANLDLPIRNDESLYVEVVKR